MDHESYELLRHQHSSYCYPVFSFCMCILCSCVHFSVCVSFVLVPPSLISCFILKVISSGGCLFVCVFYCLPLFFSQLCQCSFPSSVYLVAVFPFGVSKIIVFANPLFSLLDFCVWDLCYFLILRCFFMDLSCFQAFWLPIKAACFILSIKLESISTPNR